MMTSLRANPARRLMPLAAAVTPLALLALAGAAAPKHAAQEAPKGPTAKEQYKNIQVLKDLPADQLLPVMHNWTQSLGVRCDFCHVVETDAAGKHVGFDKDTKPQKGMARKMVLMAKDINSHFKIVDKAVRCYTCHHGHAAPENEPPATAGR